MGFIPFPVESAQPEEYIRVAAVYAILDPNTVEPPKQPTMAQVQRKDTVAIKIAYGLSDAEYAILMRESGLKPTAKNPHSTAFGMGQLILSNRIHYGDKLGYDPYTVNPNEQLQMFREYTADRYGSSEQAWEFWQEKYRVTGTGWY